MLKPSSIISVRSWKSCRVRIKELKAELELAKTKEDALVDKAESAKAKRDQMAVKRNNILMEKIQMTADRKDAESRMKALTKEMDEIQALDGSKSAEVEALEKQLKVDEWAHSKRVEYLEEMVTTLLLQNKELKEEVKRYEADSWVMVLDE